MLMSWGEEESVKIVTHRKYVSFNELQSYAVSYNMLNVLKCDQLGDMFVALF